jgi:hypothetical protein
MKPTLHTRKHSRNEASTRLRAGVIPRWRGIPNRPASDPLDANYPHRSTAIVSQRFAARSSGLASDLALAARPAGVRQRSPAL